MADIADMRKGSAVTNSYELGAFGSSQDKKDFKDGVPGYDEAPLEPVISHGEGEVHEVKETEQANIATTALHVQDDPSLTPWTFRMWFLGLGLSLFSSVLATIYTFKPQQIIISVIFLAVVSYALGVFMELILPKKGVLGKWLNPGPFNSKEHTAIIIMSSSAATCALATEILAAQRLYYPNFPGAGASIFILFSSQLIGYGFAGLNRGSLINKRKLVYPANLPMNTLIETLHRDKVETMQRLKFFWIVFACIFVWETLPEYIMPVLTGINIFCLAKRDSMVFTNIFGGSNGNEGLGVLSLCFDWQYITSSCLWYPLSTITSGFIGYMLCIFIFIGAYYGNLWRAQDFPFLSQLLFNGDSNYTSYSQFNQTLILTADNVLDPVALEQIGVPWFTPTYTLSILTNNLAITATISHMLLYEFSVMSQAFSMFHWSNWKHIVNPKSWNFRFYKASGERKEGDFDDPELDPHFRLMAAYKDAPQWWYALLLIVSVVIALVCIYNVESTLPWWGFFIALAISYILVLFTGALYGISGFPMPIQPLVQMVGGYIHPGRPLANMYFTLFGYNTVIQAQSLLRDLKLAQYAHLSPKATFTAQVTGTLLGCILNYIMMESITTNQREILLSIEGTNIWSGQVIQSWNSQATAWGGLAKYLFSVGARYQWVSLAVPLGFLVPLPLYALHRFFPKVGFQHINSALICWYLGFLCVGINSSVPIYWALGFFTQFYIRRKYPAWYLRYNYLLSAALDGGTQVVVFILSFAVDGSSGKAVPFPPYWGNNHQDGNYDYCMTNPALG